MRTRACSPVEEVDPEELAQSAPVRAASGGRTAGREERQATRPVSAERSAWRTPPSEPHSSTELIESHQGRTADAPLCLTCGTKMRPAGSCYVCEGCGSTSGCS